MFQMEYCVQGFDINLEEARLLLGKSKSSTDLHDLLGGVGGAVVSPEALRALAEGFEVGCLIRGLISNLYST